MLNIIIPMAGSGSRFVNAGFTKPKPLIEINGQTMISLVIKNLRPKDEHRFIFICQKEHIENTKLKTEIENLTNNSIIIEVNGLTDGPASSVLLAQSYIDNNSPLMIANCDQFVDFDINQYLHKSKLFDGLIMTMWADDPKWSFVKFDEKNNIVAVIEKQVVSNVATVGIYNFSNGKQFCKNAHEMINNNDRVNNEFYVAPIYNYLIEENKKLSTYDIGDKMYGLGTPEDLKFFIENYKIK